MITVGLLLFEGCDVMDVTGPYEVFLTASRLARRDGQDPPIEVRTCSPDGAAVVGYGGLGLVPSHGSLAEAGPLDAVVVPGLIDLERGLADEGLRTAIVAARAATPLLASVCTGAFLLDAAGVVPPDAVLTTHWEDAAALAARRTAPVRDDVRWVVAEGAGDAGDLVTAGGLSSGIAMALHLVQRWTDRELAVRTARQLDYAWTESRETGDASALRASD